MSPADGAVAELTISEKEFALPAVMVQVKNSEDIVGKLTR